MMILFALVVLTARCLKWVLDEINFDILSGFLSKYLFPKKHIE
jgi:hypothetical protein